MKKIHIFKFIFIITVLIFSFPSSSNANWQKSDNNLNTQQSQVSQETPSTQQDSLPSGVTQDWLNSLRDEKGNKIVKEEEPETDALQQQTFDGVVAGDEYGRSVSSAGDVNGDGFDDVIICAPKNNAGGISSGRAYIFFGGTVINNSVDVILTGGAVNNYFGRSVSGAGDVNSDGYDDVIVGADGYSSFTGRAYIYYGGVSMNSVADVILTGEFAGHNFGSSVSGAGDVNNDGFSDVVVGAYGSNSNTGKAYVYFGGSSMNNIADVTCTGETSQSYFGSSVSGAGDVNGDGYHDVIIGAYGYNSDVGKAYIYFGGVSMDNIADVSMFGGGITDYFGASVSNAGDVNDDGYSDVIVGAWGFNSVTGRAYIYYGGASMNSSADVIMTGETTNNSFGYSVSDAGDVNGDGFADVYVGAYGFSASKGRAYLYYGGASMNNVVDIYMTGDTSLNYFGYSVSGGGDVNGDGFADMIAGAFGRNSNTGRAFVYTNSLRGEDIADVTMTGEAIYDYFGYSVSTAGDVNRDGFSDVIVGAGGGYTIPHRAYIFFGGVFMDNSADVTFNDPLGGTLFGISVSTAGDVNGDGYDDVIVGKWGFVLSNSGVNIYFGGASMNNVADVTMTEVDDLFGVSVSDAGDLNGDGYDDVIVGASGNSGWAYIYFGGTSMNNVADVTMTDENIRENFGESVSGAGDVNGDGYDDVIVGASNYNSSTGRAYVYFGGASMDNVADVTMTGENVDDFFGNAVSSAGDVNGDGYYDIIVGAFGYTDRGKGYLFYGGATMNNVVDVTMTGDINELLGNSVSAAGDVNGDGYDDVVIGAVGYNNNTGRGYIFYGGSAMDNVADVNMTAEHSGDNFGYSVSSAGDLNGDGYDDVIIGAPYFENSGLTSQGKTNIYLSSPPNNRKNLFLFGAIQGMYDPVPDTEIPDTIKVYLRNSTSPFARVDSSKNILIGPQTGQYFLFRNVQNGIPYYVEVTHRNALTTWSADSVIFVNSDASIAFSVDAIYAFGNNEIRVDTSPYNVYAFYSGDVNQDGAIDLTDVIRIYNDANSFLTGYVVTDLTGDNAVDLTDVVMAYNNSVNFVRVISP